MLVGRSCDSGDFGQYSCWFLGGGVVARFGMIFGDGVWFQGFIVLMWWVWFWVLFLWWYLCLWWWWRVVRMIDGGVGFCFVFLFLVLLIFLI